VSVISTACEDGGVTDSERPPERAGLGMRQMVGAMAVLLVIIGVIVAVTRGCSFDPGAPAADRGSAPSVNAPAKLREAAATVDFPVRQPSLPRSWHANSSSTAPVGAGAGANVVVRVGWLTPGGRYVQLSQSGARLPDVLAGETGTESVRSGSVSVGGVSWSTYPARRDEAAWVASLDGAVVLITGSGSDDEFRELASAVGEAKPI
jgi:Protein of unknown function (DUF4245)